MQLAFAAARGGAPPPLVSRCSREAGWLEHSRMARTLYDLAAAEDDRRFSPYCWRVKMALHHKGLGYETVPCRFTDKDVIAFSNQGLVPVLVDGERVVSDSWVICQYLERTYPETPSLAECAQAWASALFVKLWTERSLQAVLLRILVPDILAHLHPKDRDYFRRSREARLGTTVEALAADRPAYLAQLETVLDPLRATLAAQPFLGGVPSLADYLVFGAFQWARCISPVQLLKQDDPIHVWRERMLALYGGIAAHAPGYSTTRIEAPT
jgi:glutathione S-transferase